jgi:hypothetical protein
MSMTSLTAPLTALLPHGDALTRLLIDVATFGHLAAMAAGCGAVIFADSTILRRVAQPLTPLQIAIIDHAHGIISVSLGLLWLTGLGLVGLKVGFDPAAFSPKLITKLGTVAMLTITATMMARFALPYIRASVGRRLIDAPLAEQCQLALCVGMSLAGWATALMLGSSKILKTAGDEVMVIAMSLHGLAVGGALAMAMVLYALRATGPDRSVSGLMTS